MKWNVLKPFPHSLLFCFGQRHYLHTSYSSFAACDAKINFSPSPHFDSTVGEVPPFPSFKSITFTQNFQGGYLKNWNYSDYGMGFWEAFSIRFVSWQPGCKKLIRPLCPIVWSDHASLPYLLLRDKDCLRPHGPFFHWGADDSAWPGLWYFSSGRCIARSEIGCLGAIINSEQMLLWRVFLGVFISYDWWYDGWDEHLQNGIWWEDGQMGGNLPQRLRRVVTGLWTCKQRIALLHFLSCLIDCQSWHGALETFFLLRTENASLIRGSTKKFESKDITEQGASHLVFENYS